MKKFLLFIFAGLAACTLPNNQADAQKTGGDKVTIQVTREGKIVSDTTIQLKEGQDPEAVKKVIVKVLEGDIEVISGKEGSQKMIWVTSEDDKHLSHTGDIDVEKDTCTKHKKLVMIREGDDHGEVHKKVIVKEGPEGKESEETIIVGGGDEFEITEGEEGGSKIITIKEESDEDSGTHEKIIKVIVEGDNDMKILDDEDLEIIKENNADSVKVYIIKDDDGTKVVKKMKKVEVKVEVEDEGNNKAEEPSQPAPKPEKKKK
jgi:hypothetical protein